MSGKGRSKYKRRLLWAILVLVFLLPVIKLLWIDYYEVSSSSMLPTLTPGTYIFVNKLSGLWKEASIRKGDIVVFNKPLWDCQQFNASFYGLAYVKRCAGMPGDTISIDKPDLSSVGYESRVKGKYNLNIFPHDSAFSWSYNKIGPLWIPQRGKSIRLDERNMKLYGRVLELEGYRPVANDAGTRSYTFKHNYYFFLGDNFYESEDSRFWGFVPETHLIGKAIFKFIL